jgi:hypothetical protein
MTNAKRSKNPFDSIESAQEYVALLAAAVAEAAQGITGDVADALTFPGGERRVAALRLAGYKLEQLHGHLSVSRRLLNDLRTLRRLLNAERQDVPRIAEHTSAAPPLERPYVGA